MTTPPSDWLREARIAEFDGSAAEAIAQYSSAIERVRGPEFFQAFTELGAVEFALAPLYHAPIHIVDATLLEEYGKLEPRLPVSVSRTDAANAIFKTNCGPFMQHGKQIDDDISIWDIFTFAGDMSKAELIGYAKDARALANPANMTNLISFLSEQYYNAGLSERIIDSGLLAATGVVWFAKATLMLGEDYTAVRSLPFAHQWFG